MMQTNKHMPRLIEQPYPLTQTEKPLMAEKRLWLPESPAEPCPLIIRITNGEDVTRERVFLTERGFAVYVCFADQQVMERDLEACAAWQAEMEQTLETLLREHPVLDPDRIFVDGWLTAFLICCTERFRAAVQRPALIHRATAFGNCAAGEYHFSDEPLLEQMKRLAEQSVLARIDNCKTPCLVLCQEGNLRYSREQSEQFYAAMKDRNGDVPCRMVVLPNNTFCDWQQVCLEELAVWWQRFLNRKEAAQ